MFFYEMIQKHEIQIPINKDLLVNFDTNCRRSNKLIRPSANSESVRNLISLEETMHLHPTYSSLCLTDMHELLHNIVARHYFIDFLKNDTMSLKLVQTWIDVQNKAMFANSCYLQDVLHSRSSNLNVGSIGAAQSKRDKINKSASLNRNITINNRIMNHNFNDAPLNSCSVIYSGKDNVKISSCSKMNQFRDKQVCSKLEQNNDNDEQAGCISNNKQTSSVHTSGGREATSKKHRPKSEVCVISYPSTESVQYAGKLNQKFIKRPIRMTKETLQPMIEHLLHRRHFNKFMQSSHFWRFVLEVVSSRRLKLSDILYSNVLLSYFVEFLENEERAELLNCWLALETFRQTYSNSKPDHVMTPLEATNMLDDARFIVRRYVENKSRRMKFTTNVRKVMAIKMRSNTIATNTFKLLQIITYRAMDDYFLEFLISDKFYNFITSLVISGKDEAQATKYEII
ncbi:hypothetical protein HELRODRAFT_170840 [Helobdella robusta]|uniref:RGS domain-containing protein n=1 Tax=Helobdella robusta TaxID=6412 RepID=T1F3I0_HELRO|nr:hypothetical protein HELRODRAFT_170840 [Helobdella robusta]ESO06818.1 hypothetical protein HELRODRAFT_170840 [Helobdella robusta]